MPVSRPAAFTVQYDSSADRGSADFDQRHSVVFYSYLTAKGWSLAGIGAIRTGVPFTVYAASIEPFHYNRPDLIDPGTIKENTGPVNGGRILLNRASFTDAAENQLGTAGRNAFTGPGFYNFDLSLSRAFRVSRSREAMMLLVRVDAYNFLNHVNLSNPLPMNLNLGADDFSLAPRGRVGSENGLLSGTPLGETARRLQLMFRLLF
jgi:hypothetical protein